MAERASNSSYHHDETRHGEDEGLFVDAESDNVRHRDEFMQIVSSDGTTPIVQHATYIVHIPKDQIYRVPPPENAEIVERYRNPVDNKGHGGRRRCAYWFFSIFCVLAFIISIIVCVHKFTLSPKPPSFSINHLLVKPSSKANASPGFQISMKTTNPNNVNDLGYNQGSVVSLLYKGKQIGKGHFPALENQAPGKSDPVDINLTGSSKGGLPKELEKSTSKTKAKSVNMSLSIMNIPVKMKTWLWTNTVDFNVNCDFEAEPMGDNLRIQSESCAVQK